ncbi:MAG: YraN family protein [Coriobacteriia bacterium]|nr:YraN family protein [Coriobacteriia bacterium]
MDSKELGRRGEDAAAAFLERRGMRLLERNWRCPVGEVDLVAQDGDTLVLCEVKTRRSTRAGSPEAAVGATKQRRLARLAAAYAQDMPSPPERVRFDVVAITVLAGDRALLRHHAGAFLVSG